MSHLISLASLVFLRDATGILLNPRGEAGDTTDLQNSIRQEGQKEAIKVWDMGGGTYAPYSGHRRITAMRAMGYSDILAETPEPLPASESARLAAMLAANVSKPVKPSRLGYTFKRLMLDQYWAVERVAALMGYSVEDVRIHLDLISAPANVQTAVDSGRMSLAAFRAIKSKPTPVQEKAAALDKPTVKAVRELSRKETKPDSEAQPMIGAAFTALNINPLIAEARTLKTKVMTGWGDLSEREQLQLKAIIEGMYMHVTEGDL